MTKKQIAFGISFLVLLACNSRQPGTNETAAKINSNGLPGTGPFGTKRELYFVTGISGDTVDPAGNKCNWVEMKNSKDSVFYSCMSESDSVKMGDSVWIGLSTSNEKYILRYK